MFARIERWSRLLTTMRSRTVDQSDRALSTDAATSILGHGREPRQRQDSLFGIPRYF